MSEPMVIDAEEIEEAEASIEDRIKFLESKLEFVEQMVQELIQAHGRTLKEFVQVVEALNQASEEVYEE